LKKPVNPHQLIPTRKSLLSRLKHWDDQKSWRDFYDTYSRLVYDIALKAGLTETEAEDVVQETVVAVAKGIQNFNYSPETCAFKTWLHGITKRQVANQFRKRQGKGRVLEPLAGPDGEPSQVDDLPDPASRALDQAWDREWEANLLAAAADRVKAKVSPAQYQIFDYHVLQGHSVRETSRALGINAARVYLAKHRISAQVREEVAYLRIKYV
jgi:RNA polymerase sigma factor (sigma-70 family)